MAREREEQVCELSDKLATLTARYETALQQAAAATERAIKAESLAQLLSEDKQAPPQASQASDDGEGTGEKGSATAELERRVEALRRDNMQLREHEAVLTAMLSKEAERAAAITELYKGMPSAAEYQELRTSARQLALYRESNETLRRTARLAGGKDRV